MVDSHGGMNMTVTMANCDLQEDVLELRRW